MTTTKTGIVDIRLMKDGKVIHRMVADPSLGFIQYAPGGGETFVEWLSDDEIGHVAHIPNPVEIDEILISWPTP